jgi:hypothetical protein
MDATPITVENINGAWHVSWQLGVIGLALTFVGFCALIAVGCRLLMRRERPMATPFIDERDQSGRYMANYRRWTER